jgi:hypothetical protein
MKGLTRNSNTRSTRQRAAQGQAIVEGVFATWLIITVAVGLILLLVNVGTLFLYQDKLNRVAQEAAKQIDGAKYWLGAERDDFDKNQADYEQYAENIANNAAQQLGLGTVTWDKPQYSTQTIGSREVTLVRTRCTITSIPLMGGFTLPLAGLSGVGVACDNAWPPYATCLMEVEDLKSGDPSAGKAIEVPVYGCMTHSAAGFADNTTPYAHDHGWTGTTTRSYLTTYGMTTNQLITRIDPLSGTTTESYTWQ